MPERALRRALTVMEHLSLFDAEAGTGGDLTEPLLTAAQVAVLLAVPRSTVHEYARRQRDPLPSLRIGRHRRFLRAQVHAWLRNETGG